MPVTADYWWIVEYFPASDTYALHGPFFFEAEVTAQLTKLYRLRTAAGQLDVQFVKLHLPPGADPIGEARRLRDGH